jgi:HPt (histidine-containing phosphotransfer) domain-containing protein
MTKPIADMLQSKTAVSVQPDGNVQELLERLDQDRAFLIELLTIFRQDSDKSMNDARAELANHDLPKLERTAHGLKGMMRNLVMHRAASAAGDLEAAARDRNLQSAATALQQLELAMQQLLPEVEAQLAEV